MTEDYISISTLNDFIFCPYSIYLHNVYMDTDTDIMSVKVSQMNSQRNSRPMIVLLYLPHQMKMQRNSAMQFIATKIYLFFNANLAKNHRITLFYKSISTTDCQHLTTQQYNIYHKDVGIISFTPINSKHFVFQQNITIFVHTRV